jgi:hypothetical protein
MGGGGSLVEWWGLGGRRDGRKDETWSRYVGAVCVVCVHVRVRVYDMWWMIVMCLLRLCEHAHAYVSV